MHTGEPFEPHLWLDVFRLFMATVGIYLGVVVFRYAWVVWHMSPVKRRARVHIATILSYGIIMVLFVFRRAGTLGDPLDWTFMLGSVAVALGAYGAASRARWDVRWRRKDTTNVGRD